MRYVPFELDVSSVDERGGYRVAARSSAGDGEVTVRFPLDDQALESRLETIRLALLLSSAAPLRRVAPRDERAVQQFGGVLFETFFVEDVRSLFEASRQRAVQEEGVLRLVLRIRPPELTVLPWEFLYDPRRDDYLGLSGPLVRYPEVLEAVRPLKTTPPLRILGMVAGPRDREPLDVAREQQRLHLKGHRLRAAPKAVEGDCGKAEPCTLLANEGDVKALLVDGYLGQEQVVQLCRGYQWPHAPREQDDEVLDVVDRGKNCPF